MPIQELPHVYPFRFVDVVIEERDERFTRGRVCMTVTANQRACPGARWAAPFLLAEVIAQSALLLTGTDAEVGRTGFLAGIDRFSADRAPEPGERLWIDVALARSFGAMVRFSGSIGAGDTEIARGDILVRKGGLEPPRLLTTGF